MGPSLDLSVQFAEINTTGEAPRVRKRHIKSRTGCEGCKRRKVKCDERVPCGGCARRSSHCSLLDIAGQQDGRKRNASPLQGYIAPQRINLKHMQLFHHFEHVVSETMVLGASIWKEVVLPVTLQHEFLMEAVFCMAAAHLHYLNPTKEEYHRAELQHLSNAIGGLRTTLAGEITPKNADALFACSLLLYHHAWSSLEQDDSSTAEDVNFDLCSLIPLASGLKSVFIETTNFMSEVWRKVAWYHPRLPLIECANRTNFPSELEQAFKTLFRKIKPQERNALNFETYMTECHRLIPILSVLKLSQSGVDVSPLLYNIVRYLFTFPMIFSDEFILLMRKQDELAQAVLSYFYAAVKGLMSKQFWWTQRRAQYMLGKIRGTVFEEALEDLALFSETPQNQPMS